MTWNIPRADGIWCKHDQICSNTTTSLHVFFLHSLQFCALSAPAFAALSASKRHAEKEAFSIHNNRTSLKRRSYAKLPDFAYLNPIIDFHLRHPTPKTHIKILHKYVDTRRGYESSTVDDSEIRQEQLGAPGNAGILCLHLHRKLNMDTQLTFSKPPFLVKFRVRLVFYIHFVIRRISGTSRVWRLLGGSSQVSG